MNPDQPPAWASHDRVLLTGGFVYNPADPFATSMLVAGSEVAWVGSEGAALAMADGVDRVVQLNGALLAPAFVDAHAAVAGAVTPTLLADRSAAGVGLVQVVPATAGADHGALPLEAPPTAMPMVIDLRPRSGADAQGEAVELDGPLADVAGRVQAQLQGGQVACLQVRTAVQLAAALDVLSAIEGPTSAIRVDLGAVPSAEQIDRLASSRVTVCLLADEGEGIAAMPLASMAAAGIPLAFGGGDPWTTIGTAVNHPDDRQRISTRAAFLAHTRGGWRAAGMPGRGVLVPGAAAHYAVWEVGDLVVQAPDDRIQAWSTDPRSGTPGLPDLSPNAPKPRLRGLAVWGASVPVPT